jgi:hypothetical protein
MSMHPIFKQITDGFLGIPEKLKTAASVSGNEATPDYAGNHRSGDYCAECGMEHPKYMHAAGNLAVGTCQEGGRCNHKAKFLSPTGLPVCGVHRRTIDAYYERLIRPDRCKPL